MVTKPSGCSTRPSRAASRYDLVLLDLTVPGGMGGAEAVKYIREMRNDVCVLVNSGYADDSVLARYRDYGFDGVLAKPFTLPDLRRVLRELEEGTSRDTTARLAGVRGDQPDRVTDVEGWGRRGVRPGGLACLWGDLAIVSFAAWGDQIVWGDSLVHPRGDHSVWGDLGAEHIVWGELIVWGISFPDEYASTLKYRERVDVNGDAPPDLRHLGQHRPEGAAHLRAARPFRKNCTRCSPRRRPSGAGAGPRMLKLACGRRLEPAHHVRRSAHRLLERPPADDAFTSATNGG